MTRRGFFQRTVGAIAAAGLAPLLAPIVRWSSRLWIPIPFHGIPLVSDQDVPSNRIYCLAVDGAYVIHVNNQRTLITGLMGSPPPPTRISWTPIDG